MNVTGRVNLITQTTGISRKVTAHLSSAHQKKLLNLSIHNLRFLSNFEFSKSVQYSPSYNFFNFEPLARVHVHRGIKLRRQLEFCKNLLSFSIIGVLGKLAQSFSSHAKRSKEF